MTKTELRKKIKTVLELHKQEFESESERISNEILTSPFYKNAQIILAYMALKDETNIFKLIKHAQSDNKKVFIPKTEQNSLKMDFFELKENSTLLPGNFGILEHFLKNDNAQNFSDNLKNFTDKKILILVPGRAFSKKGYRLGRGKGYYDNFLKNIFDNFDDDFNCTVAGVCFPFQISEEIPTEQHDFKMDFVFC